MAFEDVLLPLLSWGSPIGLAIFLAGLGYFIKCAMAAQKEKNLKIQKVSFRRLRILDSDTTYMPSTYPKMV